MEFLNTTECHYTWRLFDIDFRFPCSAWEKLELKLRESDLVHEDDDDMETKSWQWSLRLSYAYELRHENIEESLRLVDEVIATLQATEVDLFKRYKSSFLHIALSLKAFLLVEECKLSVESDVVESLLRDIKPTSEMNAEEKSAVLSARAEVLSGYGSDGTIKSVPFLREAIKLNAKEVEWRLSLVTRFHRKRHFIKSSNIDWKDIEEAVDMMESLLNDPGISEQDVISTKYFLAVAYYDFIKGKSMTDEIVECRQLILTLCEELAQKSKYPLVLSFCAERFQHLAPDETGKLKGLKLIEKMLSLFPLNVGVNTSASNIYRKRNMWNEAAKCSRTASELGGFGSTWIYLECLVVLNEPFDDKKFFDEALDRFPSLYRNSIRILAALFCFYIKKDVVRGAEYFKLAVDDDPGLHMLQATICAWVDHQICPLRIAYNQVVLALKENHPFRVSMALRNLKIKIEKLIDTSQIPTTVDLVGKFDVHKFIMKRLGRNGRDRFHDRWSDSASVSTSKSWRSK